MAVLYTWEPRWTEEETFKFWDDPSNRELIKSALPLTADKKTTRHKAHFTPTSGNRLDASFESEDVEGTIELVPENDLREYPYQCVGKMFGLDQNKSAIRSLYTSAFYIGNSRVMTSAHAFDKVENLNALVFVPAMKDWDDIHGENYGRYNVIRYTVHSADDNDQTKAQDIAIAIIGRGQFEGCYVESFHLKGIELKLDVPHKPGLSWMAVGYGKKDNECSDDGSSDDGGKMTKVAGTLVRGLSTGHQVVMDIQLRYGMSGGPWLLLPDCKSANGCQSGTDFNMCTSVSPYFSKKLISKLSSFCDP